MWRAAVPGEDFLEQRQLVRVVAGVPWPLLSPLPGMAVNELATACGRPGAVVEVVRLSDQVKLWNGFDLSASWCFALSHLLLLGTFSKIYIYRVTELNEKLI